jgi:hypothetical protein
MYTKEKFDLFPLCTLVPFVSFVLKLWPLLDVSQADKRGAIHAGQTVPRI